MVSTKPGTGQCLIALRRDRRFPFSVFGPVLLSALRRLASICRNEVIPSRDPRSSVKQSSLLRRLAKGSPLDLELMCHLCERTLCDFSCYLGKSRAGLRLLPEFEGDWNGIDVELLPPCHIVTRPM